MTADLLNCAGKTSYRLRVRESSYQFWILEAKQRTLYPSTNTDNVFIDTVKELFAVLFQRMLIHGNFMQFLIPAIIMKRRNENAASGAFIEQMRRNG
jgi:hypothetical protein